MSPERLDFVLKIASRCNLNCSYCYVYNKGDDTWKNVPAIMAAQVYEQALARIEEYCRQVCQPRVKLIFHGGEPTLVGAAAFDRMCDRARRVLAGREVTLSLQTNGTLLDDNWARVIARHDVSLGISLDGPPDVHDRVRLTHTGAGSHARILRALDQLLSHNVELHFLTVMQLGQDPLRVHEHLVSLGARGINYLFPDYVRTELEVVRGMFGPLPCADFMLPIFARELETLGETKCQVTLLRTMTRLILGGPSDMDIFGNGPLRFLFINTGGGIEMLDVLRICGSGFADTGLNVLDHAIAEVRTRSELHERVVFTGLPLPSACGCCVERELCAGGYLPHRWSRDRGFDNPSIWCDDILAMFRWLRGALGVDHEETGLRRSVLASLSLEQYAGKDTTI